MVAVGRTNRTAGPRSDGQSDTTPGPAAARTLPATGGSSRATPARRRAADGHPSAAPQRSAARSRPTAGLPARRHTSRGHRSPGCRSAPRRATGPTRGVTTSKHPRSPAVSSAPSARCISTRKCSASTASAPITSRYPSVSTRRATLDRRRPTACGSRRSAPAALAGCVQDSGRPQLLDQHISRHRSTRVNRQ